MSATPPRARLKYSREPPPSHASGADGTGVGQGPEESPTWGTALRAGILGGGLLAAVLLVVSEFTTLYRVHTSSGALAGTVLTHAHDFYALFPIALLVTAFAVGSGLLGSRLALLGLAALALVALGITLIGDLPDAQTTGTVFYGGRFQTGTASPSTGLYLETLASVLLVVVAGCGLLLAGPPWRSSES